jgi:hypothetical protein
MRVSEGEVTRVMIETPLRGPAASCPTRPRTEAEPSLALAGAKVRRSSAKARHRRRARVSYLGATILWLTLPLFLLHADRASAADYLPSGVEDARLSVASSEFVGKPVRLLCGADDNGLFLGMTVIDEALIWLDEPAVCAPARSFLSGWRPRLDRKRNGSHRLARALLVLTHESVHASGDRAEAHTECVAIQRVPEMAHILGEHHPLYIAALTRLALWWHRQLRGTVSLDGHNYWDGTRCRKDGAWDLTPGDGVWP